MIQTYPFTSSKSRGEAIITMIKVKKQKGESDDRLIARFRKKVIESGVLWEYREKERHKPASERRKEKKYRVKHMIELEKTRG